MATHQIPSGKPGLRVEIAGRAGFERPAARCGGARRPFEEKSRARRGPLGRNGAAVVQLYGSRRSGSSHAGWRGGGRLLRMATPMTMDPPARHVPVLGPEAVAMLAPRDGGIYVDATFGAGGYTR